MKTHNFKEITVENSPDSSIRNVHGWRILGSNVMASIKKLQINQTTFAFHCNLGDNK